jgi:DNA-binding Lrp family transcriptional regulator
MLTKLEKRIIASIQDDIAIKERPYLEIAKNLGISQEALLEKLKDLCNRGIIRRFGATIRHQKSGFEANAMAAWEVDEDRIDKVGKILASFSQVSHCYRRNPTENWPYNLYTMIHSKDEKSCREIVRKMSDKAFVDTYILLFSRKELKKTSMKYFPNDNSN